MPEPLSNQPAPTSTRPRVHYIAAVFYSLIALGGIIITFQGQPIGLVSTVLFGLYAFYLWRGGRFVIFFW